MSFALLVGYVVNVAACAAKANFRIRPAARRTRIEPHLASGLRRVMGGWDVPSLGGALLCSGSWPKSNTVTGVIELVRAETVLVVRGVQRRIA